MKINEILEDISIAIIVLTRVPLNNILSINQNIEIHRGQWAYPIVGAALGLVLFLRIGLFEGIGIPRQISILISLSLGILLTGALHEDGVADFFDSLAGRDYTTRQKILRDSRLGTYGVLSLIIVFMLKFLLILGLESYLALACGLIACSSLSRFSILLLVNYSNLSKQAGLTKHLKKVNDKTILLSGIFLYALDYTCWTSCNYFYDYIWLRICLPFYKVHYSFQ
jgi:adenosylcobinamide-GDP ribazoletransferase